MRNCAACSRNRLPRSPHPLTLPCTSKRFRIAPESRNMSSNATPTGGAGLKFRLSVMMFLQFFIWGAWYPLVFNYLPSLGFNDWQVPLILGMFNLSALVAMFFSNQFADRNFAAQKFLAFSHLIGGAAIFALAFIKRP